MNLLHNPLETYPQATVAALDPTRGDLPRRRLDVERLTEFLSRLEAAQASAVLLAASTGQGHLRTGEELLQWLQAALSAPLHGMLRMMLLRPEDGMVDNQRLLQAAAAGGLSAVFFRPGTDLPADALDAQVAQQIQPLVAMAAALGLPVGLYSIPDVSGLPLRPEAAVRIVHGPGGDHVVAIKVTEANYAQSTLPFLQHPDLKHLKIVQGWDPHLARALQDGPQYDALGRQRCGVTSGPMSFAVWQYQHLLAAADRGDWDEVRASQQAVDRLFAAMQDDPQRFADLQRAKYIMGLGQPLTSTVSEEQVDRVFVALEGLPRIADRQRLARSLDLMENGPFHQRLTELAS